MLIHDALFDLGTNGLFMLSLDSTCDVYGPVLPPQLHYARWHLPDGTEHDRTEVVIRKVDAETLRRPLNELAARYELTQMPERLEWVFNLVADMNYIHPVSAAHVGETRLALLFLGAGLPPLLRLIDLAAGAVLDELSFSKEDIQRMTRPSMTKMRLHGRIMDACPDHFILYFGYSYFLFSTVENRLQQVEPAMVDTFAMGAGFILNGNRETQTLNYCGLDGSIISTHISPYSGWMVRHAGCAQEGRFATSHSGGTVEFLDVNTRQNKAYRPFPKTRKDTQPGVALDSNGRYMFASDGTTDCVIDLTRDLIAEVDLPHRDNSDPFTFSGTPDYFPAYIVRDQDICAAHRGHLQSFPYTELEWRPAVLAKPVRAKSAARASFPKKLLKQWSRRYIQLAAQPAASAPGHSHLYGSVQLPASMEWPQHNGRSMLLLCHLNLAEVATVNDQLGLPTNGALLVFSATDEAGEFMDEDFNPLKIEVIYISKALEASETPQSGCIAPATPLHLAPGTQELPYIDALIVEAANLEHEQIESYRSYLDNTLPAPPKPDFRLGGYPAAVQNNSLEREAQGFQETGERFELSDDIQTSLDWLMLMQFDSDDHLMWGTDMGKLYLMIHKAHLRQLDFSQVFAVTAGY